MSFIQAEFLAFFGIVFALYWGIPRIRFQNLLLAVASAIFYGWIHPWFLILLYSSATLDFFVGKGMRRFPDHKGKLLALSMAGNLGMLGWFKYADFFIGSVAQALTSLGLESGIHTLGILLPVGISFYTFQTMSYTIDIYRGDLEPRRDPLPYLVFVSFFPQLVAGPIERAATFLPQVEQPRRFSWEQTISGLSLAMWGGLKKVVIADAISPYVDKMLLVDQPAGPMIVAAAVGFTIQILADFSGYTDIARGTARMLGFKLTLNFDRPYLAATPMEFWQRWHISFSTWLRDYVYMPLAFSDWVRWLKMPGSGELGPVGVTARASMITMVLSGLWHGATWNCVVWGFYQGVLVVVYAVGQARIPRKIRKKAHWPYLMVPLMYGWTTLGLLIFREHDLLRTWHYLGLNPLVATHDEWAAALTLGALCALGGGVLTVGGLVERRLWPRMREGIWALPLQTTFWTAAALLIFLFVRLSNNDFIYFQF